MSGLILPPGMTPHVVGDPVDLNTNSKMLLSSAPYISAPQQIKMFLRNALAAGQQGKVTPQLEMALSAMQLYWVVYNNAPVMVYLLQASAIDSADTRLPTYLENQVVPLPELQKALLLYGQKGAPAKMQEISKFLVSETVKAILTKEKKVLINPQTGVIVLPTFNDGALTSFALSTITPSANLPIFGVEFGETFLITTQIVNNDMTKSQVAGRVVLSVANGTYKADSYVGPDLDNSAENAAVMAGITASLKIANSFLTNAGHKPAADRFNGQLPTHLCEVLYRVAPTPVAANKN